MTSTDRRNMSLAYYAKAVQEWRASGKPSAVINRMLICCLEMTRTVHKDPVGDAITVLEIADGLRAA
jgi:hypothetical protein